MATQKPLILYEYPNDVMIERLHSGDTIDFTDIDAGAAVRQTWYDSNTLAQWLLTDNSTNYAADNTGNGHSLSDEANINSNEPGIFTRSIQFLDGTFLEGAYDVNPSQFTIDGWVNPSEIYNQQIIFSKQDVGNEDPWHACVKLGIYDAQFYGVVVINSTDITVTAPLPFANNWYHVGITFDRYSLSICVNGIKIASTMAMGSIDYKEVGSEQAWLLGSGRGTNGFTGHLEDFRLSSIARDETYFRVIWERARIANTSLKYIYNSTNAGASLRQTWYDNDTLAQWLLIDNNTNGTADNTGNGWDLEDSALMNINEPGIFTRSVQFLEDTFFEGGYDLRPAVWTIDGWFNPSDVSTQQVLFTKQDVSNEDPWHGCIVISVYSGAVWGSVTTVNNDSYSRDNPINSPAILANRWYHVGLTYNGTMMELYLNGTKVAESPVSGDLNYGTLDNDRTWILGADRNNHGFKGHLEDWRISSVVRDASYFKTIWERARLNNTSLSKVYDPNPLYQPIRAYDRYTPRDSNTIVQWLLDETTNDSFYDSGGDGNYTLGAAPSGIERPGFMHGCNSFSTDGPMGVETLRPPIITVEAWIYPFSATNSYIVWKRANNSEDPYDPCIYIEYNSSSQLRGMVAVGTPSVKRYTPWFTIDTHKWHHIGLAYSSAYGAMTLYVDGEVATYYAMNGAIHYGSGEDYWGIAYEGDSGYCFDGKIADVRISNIFRLNTYFRAIWDKANICF